MRILLGGGGTGGHVYPALAVLEALRLARYVTGDSDVLYVGDAERAEAALAARAGIPFRGIATGAVLGRGPLALAGSLVRNVKGLMQSLATLRGFQPDVVFVTGGYVSVPVVLAARLRHIPVVLCLPDAAPGLAVRFLARFATHVTVSDASATSMLPAARVVVTGYPVRKEFQSIDRDAARERLGLSADDRLLLVMGGSLGARSINRAVANSLGELLSLCRVIHVSGEDDAGWLGEVRAGLPAELQVRYSVHAYLHEGVAETMAAADLAVCRAGASVLGELPSAGLPSVLIPYPLAGAHQRVNARILADRGAAIQLEERDITRLPALLRELMADQDRLTAMRQNALGMAQPQAAAAIAALLVRLAAADPPKPVADGVA